MRVIGRIVFDRESSCTLQDTGVYARLEGQMGRPVEPMIHDRAIFERLFDFSPDAILVSDKDGRIIEASAQAERIFGYSHDELIGQPVEILVSAHSHTPDPLEPIDRHSTPQVLPGNAELDQYGRQKDGVEFPVEVMLRPVETAEGTVVIRVVRDLTERRRIEKALQKSEKQFRALFEHSPDAIVVTDPQGKIAEINAQVEKFFGYDRRELLGQSVEVLIPERFRTIHPKYRADYGAQARDTSHGNRVEPSWPAQGRIRIPCRYHAQSSRDQEGKITLSVIRDLSEKMRVQEELERRKREKRYLEEELNTEHRFEDIIGESTDLRETLKQVEIVSATDVTVLILGETGTGKDLVARAIHHLSSRRERTLVKLNCAAIPTGFLESELFGHEKGAFTGAISQKIGRLELAHQGTLFLDEVGDIPQQSSNPSCCAPPGEGIRETRWNAHHPGGRAPRGCDEPKPRKRMVADRRVSERSVLSFEGISDSDSRSP